MQPRLAPSTPVDVRTMLFGGPGAEPSWVRGYFVVADDGDTIQVEGRTGIFAGIPVRYARCDVRPAELAPGKIVRIFNQVADVGGRCGKILRLAARDHVVVDLGAWRVTIPARQVEGLR